MPNFSAITLDRLLDSGASTNTTSGHRRSSSESVPENKVPARPQMSPALYTTPDSLPLPDSSVSSFPPSSPYLVNHKRRGPRLRTSFSGENVATVVAEKKDGNEGETESKPGFVRSFSEDSGVSRELKEDRNDAIGVQEAESNNGLNVELGDDNGELKVVMDSSLDRDGGEMDDFFDPQDSMSFSSNTDCEDYCVDRSKMSSSAGEFFDAAEELSLSCDSGRQQLRSLSAIESELRGMRLSFLMEIEKRKQAEEALNIMLSQWQIVRKKLRSVGLILPDDLSALSGDSQSDIDPTEDICRQIHLARFVSESIGRGIAKSEADAEMNAQLEVKNFEIARLSDRLNYYETMNKEMSHMNQEAIEVARHQRERRRRQQKWVWSSIGAAITLGSVALAWSYIPAERGSSETHRNSQ